MTTPLRPLLLALAVALLGPGCSSSGDGPTLASNQVTIHPAGQGDIEVLNRNQGLHGDCAILSARALYEGEIMTCVVDVEGRRDAPQTFDYRWSFFDQDNFPITTGQERWDTLFVGPLERKTVEGRSPRPRAVRALFELRYHSGY